MLMRRLRNVLLAIGLAVAGCSTLDHPSPVPAAIPAPVEASPTPSVVVPPIEHAHPCLAPLRQVANASQLMADKLVALRAPLLETYDAWKMLGLARSANATLKFYGLSIPGLQPCTEASALARRAETFAKSAALNIGVVLASGTAVTAAPRSALVALFQLLPEVIEISRSAKKIADKLGLDLAAAEVPKGSTKPLGKLPPLPKPTGSTGSGSARSIGASFFGRNVRVAPYRVTGQSPWEITSSMGSNGPYNDWLQGTASGLTKAIPDYRFVFSGDGLGTCSIVSTGSPAILITYRVTLPKWAPPKGVSSSTIEWWNELVVQIATHEKHHVTIYREAQKDLNAALSSATCATADARLDAVWSATRRKQCQFDMDEYGYASGLSYKTCVNR